MLFREVSAAVAATIFAAIPAGAQSLHDISGPAETPPASFTGGQYVDSRGCVFMRAGYSGTVNWVPRVGKDKKVLCGYVPSLSVAAAPATAPAPATVPAAPVVVTPAATVQAAVRPSQAPVRPAAPVATAETVPAVEVIHIPKGYLPAWQDGRLNPDRGLRTPEGDAAMYRVWTKTVPMTLVPPQKGVPAQVIRVVYDSAPPTTARMSTSTAPSKGYAQSGSYVQVGSFSVSANADTAAARLKAAGLPVTVRGAGKVRVVLAGPFQSGDDTKAALASVQAAGFSDAFVRK